MDLLTLFIVFLGVTLTFLVLIDVYLTVLHVDTDGPVARATLEVVWSLTMVCARVFPKYRRNLLALSGPTMMILTFIVWLMIFILGFAFIYWPFLELFRSDEEIVNMGFMEAFYYSGITATVLGYGDITPLHGVLRVTAFLQSGMGFALLTGVVTYLINVVTGLTERNALALRVWAETGRTGDGTNSVIRSLSCEECEDFHLRLQMLLDVMYEVHQKMHQYPILDLFYRSKDPHYSPELMVKSIAEIAIAGQLVSTDQRYHRLKPASTDLGDATVEMMSLIGSKNRTRYLIRKLEDPTIENVDRTYYEHIRNRLIEALPMLELDTSEEDDEILHLIAKLRSFLTEMDRLTGWRMDHPRKQDRLGS